MEQTRLLLAIALSFLVFFLWTVFFSPKAPPPPAGVETTQQKAEIKKEPQPKAIPPGQTAPSPEIAAPEKDSAGAVRHITVDAPLYRMTLSEKGAAVTSMVLKKYRETVDPDSPKKELVPAGIPAGTVLLSASGIQGLAHGIYTADTAQDTLEVHNQPAEIRFRYTAKNNITIDKIYRFRPDTYLVDVSVILHNGSDQPLSEGINIALLDEAEVARSSYGFEGPSGLINDKLEQIKPAKIDSGKTIDGSIRWIAIERLYFMDSIVSKEDVKGQMVLSNNDKLLENQLAFPKSDVAPGESHTWDLSLFMGPKSLSILRAADNQLERAINFGWVDIIAKPCLWFMNFIYRFIPNYGIAIIILTIITRLLFWPLAQKSYKSMNDMRKLQPLMKELKEKYKDDKARINQETMALYRTYKVNPMGGCLPMLVQLPVFFALYRMLYQAIELRHAPFFGWINDLSAPDRLFHFNVSFHIPFMQPPYGIPVLTLIMGATMILQQKMSPAAADPTQAKMMMMMPVVFTVIFINFPSGLVLYWLVSNLVSIAQQYYTQKKLA